MSSPGSSTLIALRARNRSSSSSLPQPQDAAARPDGRQQPSGRMRHQEEQQLAGGSSRLFSSAIRGICVHVVGGVDDDDAIAAIMGRHRQETADAPHLVNGQRLFEALAAIDNRSRQVQQRGMRAPCAIRRLVVLDMSGAATFSGAARASGCDSTWRARRKASVDLPIPALPASTSAWWHAPAAVVRGQLRHLVVMAEEKRVLRRLGHTLEAVMLFGIGGARSSCLLPDFVWLPARCSTFRRRRRCRAPRCRRHDRSPR